MILDPVILAAPAILHRDDRYTIWHAGVVLGSPGVVVVNLDIDSIEETEWGLSATLESQPIQARIETAAGEPTEILGDNGYGADRYTLNFHARFPGQVRGRRGFPPLVREQLVGATLHIDIYPFEMRLAIGLDPR